MKQEWSLYSAILAIAIVGLLAFGVPASALAYAALALACPLMVIFIHRGAKDTAEGSAAPTATASTSPPAGGHLARRSS
jgi:hypothetical protein